MTRLVNFVTVILLLIIQIARADESREIASRDWKGAAKFALSKIRYDNGTIFVVDKTLSDAALSTLRSLGQVISKEALPQQDIYVIPPGPYMLVRKFDEENGIFEFTETMGPYRKDAHRNCGDTLAVAMRLGTSGEWEYARPIQELVC
jgi:hypothetical protein